jgi:chromosomal replication initiator protein
MAVTHFRQRVAMKARVRSDCATTEQQEVVMEDSRVAALSTQLNQHLGAQRYELWFNNQARLCIDGDCLTIRAARPFVRDWLRKNLASDIRSCWEAVAGRAGTVEFDLDEALAHSTPKSGKCESSTAGTTTPRDGEAPAKPEKAQHSAPASPSPSRKSTRTESTSPRKVEELATFVVGPGNEYACHAAEMTARGRHQASLLVFCGATGIGKTHLLRAIVRDYRRNHPRAAAVYLSAEQFTTGFVDAVRGSGLPSFRQKCRGARLLAIDDLQFFAGKARTLEELLHTLDSMTPDGRQVVFASDRPLGELRGLGQELLSRLSAGLICEITPADFATRLGILRQLCKELGLAADESVLTLIAQNITEGARELKGALLRIKAMSDAFDEPISHELTTRALADLARHSARPVKLADVQKAVCDEFGIDPSQLRSERKGRSLSEPRMIAMWLARKYTKAPWSEIGEYFGRRSHSTVISAHRRVEKLISSQAQIGVANRSRNVEDAIRRLEAAIRTA